MAGRAGRTYKRDGNGRFASTGTSGKKSRPPAKSVAKGVNKLTRDNAGKITSVGGDGATARGGRLKTAAGNLRATQTKRLKTMQGVSYGKKVSNKQPLDRFRLQSADARADRVNLSDLRKREANFLKTLPKGVRRAAKERLPNHPSANKYRSSVNEAMTILRGNFGKRKNKLSDGRIEAIGNSILYSARKAKVALADPSVGRRLKKIEGERKAAKTTRIAGGRAGMVGKGGKAKDVGNIVRTVMADKSLRSDKQRTAEMIRRGIGPKSDFVKLVAANTTISSRTSKTVPMKVVGSATPKGAANTKEPKPSPKTDGRVFQLTQFRDSQRKRLREIRRQIKEAGPSAGGLRLEKLKIESRLNDLNTELIKVGATTSVRRRKP